MVGGPRSNRRGHQATTPGAEVYPRYDLHYVVRCRSIKDWLNLPNPKAYSPVDICRSIIESRKLQLMSGQWVKCILCANEYGYYLSQCPRCGTPAPRTKPILHEFAKARYSQTQTFKPSFFALFRLTTQA